MLRTKIYGLGIRGFHHLVNYKWGIQEIIETPPLLVIASERYIPDLLSNDEVHRISENAQHLTKYDKNFNYCEFFKHSIRLFPEKRKFVEQRAKLIKNINSSQLKNKSRSELDNNYQDYNIRFTVQDTSNQKMNHEQDINVLNNYNVHWKVVSAWGLLYKNTLMHWEI